MVGTHRAGVREVLGIPQSVVLDVMRSWRAAREDRVTRLPCLYRALVRHRLEILTPSFDSLMTICEAAMKRAFIVGEGGKPSVDETILISMLVDPGDAKSHIVCSEERLTLLECALRSTRLMMVHALTRTSTGR